MIDQRYLAGDYLASTGDWHEGDAAWKARHIADLMHGLPTPPRAIGDVGCGTGGVLDHLLRRLGGDVSGTGYEIAPEAAAMARRRARPGLDFRAQSLFDTDDRFDLLISCDVFEHVPDYRGFLASMRRHGDAFIFHIPLDLSARTILNGWPEEARRTVGHIHFFTEATALGTLRDCGYTILGSRLTHTIMQPPPATPGLKLRRLPHRLLYGLNPSLCAKLLGGCGLLVLAR